MIAGPALREFAMEVLDDVRLGKEIVADGHLTDLRERLGLTRSVMAELLNTSVFTYSSWENRPETRIRPTTAGKVGRFCRLASEQLGFLAQDGISINDLVPLHIAASMLGVPQEVLLQWYRSERFEAVDLGILGLWIHRDKVQDIAR